MIPNDTKNNTNDTKTILESVWNHSVSKYVIPNDSRLILCFDFYNLESKIIKNHQKSSKIIKNHQKNQKKIIKKIKKKMNYCQNLRIFNLLSV